jgi:MoxR-like ATPase
MVGKHGLGKSQIVEQYAKENGYHLETLFLSQQEVADLIGIPIQENGVTYWSKPIWMKRMEDANKEGKHCVLFLDELSRAPLDVRQSALQLVLDRQIHEHKLPELDGIKTFVVSADNPSDIYQTDEMDAALADRFATFEVEVDVNGWLKWARYNNIEPVITDFIAEFPEKLHFIPESEKGATPRGWAKLSDILKSIEKANMPKSMYFDIINSKIGKTVGASFFHYFNNYIKVVKPEDIKEMLEGENLETEKGLKKAAKKLAKVTKEIEAISATELAEKLKDKVQNEEWNPGILTAYLDSLNLEIMASILKSWKGNEDTMEFFVSYAETVPNNYIFMKIVSERKDINL